MVPRKRCMRLDIFNKKKNNNKIKDSQKPQKCLQTYCSYSQQCHISSLSERCLNKITNADMPPTSLDTCSPAQHSRSLLLFLSHGKLIRRNMQIQPCHYALDTCKSIRTAPTCPDMYIVHYLQALRSINRTLVILKRQERVKKKKRKLLL